MKAVSVLSNFHQLKKLKKSGITKIITTVLINLRQFACLQQDADGMATV